MVVMGIGVLAASQEPWRYPFVRQFEIAKELRTDDEIVLLLNADVHEVAAEAKKWVKASSLEVSLKRDLVFACGWGLQPDPEELTVSECLVWFEKDDDKFYKEGQCVVSFRRVQAPLKAALDWSYDTCRGMVDPDYREMRAIRNSLATPIPLLPATK